MTDNMEIFFLGQYRGAIIDATEMILQMAEAHKTDILETYVLGQSYIAAGLLTGMLKGNDRLAMVFECGGPIKGINVEVNAAGSVRGYLKNNPIPLEKPQNDFDLNLLFGPGFLSIIKYSENSKQPFKGQVMITYGEIAKDLAHYYTTSENLPTAFNLSVKFNKEGRLIGAGGIFIQKMPQDKNTEKINSKEQIDEAAQIEEALLKMPSLGITLSRKNDLSQIISETFENMHPKVIGSRKIQFKCSCSRELFSNYLKALSKEDKADIKINGPFPLITKCYNCNKEYKFVKKEINQLFNE